MRTSKDQSQAFRNSEISRELRTHAADEKHVKDLVIGLYVASGQPNLRIAELLGVSQPEVTRAIARLRQRGELETIVHCPESLRDQVYSYWRDTKLEERVLERLAQVVGTQRLNRIFVVRGDKSPPRDARHAQVIRRTNLERCTAMAATRLEQYLTSCGQQAAVTMGVGWGYTLAQVAEHLAQRFHDERLHGRSIAFGDCEVFNIIGDWVSPYEASQRSLAADSTVEDERARRQRTITLWSSLLAKRFADVLHAKLTVFKSPGWIPIESRAKLAARRQQADAYLRMFPEYRAIFDADGYAYRADLVLTGIGGKGVYEQLLDETGRRHEFQRVLESAVGDLCGIPLLRRGASPTRDSDLLSDTFIGMKAAHFQSIARRAQPDPREAATPSRAHLPLGVLAVAENEEKAPAVVAAVAAGLVNELVIDSRLAEGILEQSS